MPGSRASVLGAPEDFESALRPDGVVGLLIIRPGGGFRARLTQITLDRLRLSAVEEGQARIAFVAVPAGKALIAFTIDGGPSPTWGGIAIAMSEMVAFGPGERLHTRTVGSAYWGAIEVPEADLGEYGRALSGSQFCFPRAAYWRPRPAAVRQLRHLHRAAIRMAEARSGALTDAEAVHGLEQQLLHALIDCLAAGIAEEEPAAARRHRDILARFEDLLRAEPHARIAEICAALGVSDRLLRACCRQQLGMGPIRYLRLHRIQRVHRLLRIENPGTANVAEVAGRYGFRDPSRFAANYRAMYGELPSATLRRNPQAASELSLGRRRMKFS